MGQETDKRKKRSTSVSGNAEPSLNLDEIREIAELVDQYGFTDFEFENEKIRLRLSKSVAVSQIAVQPVTATAPIHAQPSVEAKSPTESTKAVQEAKTEVEEDNLHKITSPIVGTFYRAPAPDKPPYVQVGDKVQPDTVVCIVEAMKLMNEIQAGVSGEVVKIYVENGQPVEYGQPLFGIRV
ncbi:MAG: acetyl-CoA carboxylase, biotin carboxyl carrier protein [Pyrinomonadaceae bacterium]|nr:MAG: acetyl-CoA carboxylase, biotin carboxyl carrier protein [Pyrinomonadaceae bacterium]